MRGADLIQTLREGALLTVTINRPDKANSLTTEMLVALRDIFRASSQDDTLRAVLITGAGGRVFCAGADLNTLYDETDGPDPWDEMARALHAVPVPTIAAINGPCIGGGLTLALGCDMRFAGPKARFSYPVLKNNVLPGQYDVDRLRALIGQGRCAAILLGGDVLGAEEAAAWGLVDRLVEQSDLIGACRHLCATALAAEGAHLKTLKSMLRGAA
ncbi:enoyl-CoA hydratase/isomerase family protein [Ruegeria arenilitoris]|uniref:enoyl-CoA hydratase/isomerase family protein n=1 Tax=Ruegeria arenilitoris TaxID=1173585 RepID=UPI00147A8148|nr:enoyl-CoA hydratase/isomerase family protein [Ruegeria arenilitoris]